LSGKVSRLGVERADASWIHGRGQNAGFEALRGSRVAVLGCGSIGAAVAVALSSAGVGHLTLVDEESLEWANIGRHPLGAQNVRRNKAEALGEHLIAMFPHIGGVQCRPKQWQDAISENPGLLDSSDVVISAMGSWAAEGALNQWHLFRGRRQTVIYGWSEPHATVGHAVAIAASGGCLQCGFTSTGLSRQQFTDWPAETLRQEPACGAVYQPYGPVDLAPTVNLIAELAIDFLLGKSSESLHRIWIGRSSLLEAAGGKWSAAGMVQLNGRSQGGCFEEQPWLASGECRECQAAAL
jgi:threonine dehydrogenase-like Zn-dependent dehydrogenase